MQIIAIQNCRTSDKALIPRQFRALKAQIGHGSQNAIAFRYGINCELLNPALREIAPALFK